MAYEPSANVKVSPISGNLITIKNLSDIDHTRIIKWLDIYYNANDFKFQKNGNEYILNTLNLPKSQVDKIIYYLRSQKYI